MRHFSRKHTEKLFLLRGEEWNRTGTPYFTSLPQSYYIVVPPLEPHCLLFSFPSPLIFSSICIQRGKDPPLFPIYGNRRGRNTFLILEQSVEANSTMRDFTSLITVLSLLLVLHAVNGDNPYRFYTWKVTYGDIYPLGVKQQVLSANCFLLCFLCCVSWMLLGLKLRKCGGAGNLDKWAVSGADDWLCYQWQLDYQCLQLLEWAISHFLVCKLFNLYCFRHSCCCLVLNGWPFLLLLHNALYAKSQLTIQNVLRSILFLCFLISWH